MDNDMRCPRRYKELSKVVSWRVQTCLDVCECPMIIRLDRRHEIITLLNHCSLHFTKKKKKNLFHSCALNGFYMMITNSQVLLKILRKWKSHSQAIIDATLSRSIYKNLH